jgi:hypothetical protein
LGCAKEFFNEKCLNVKRKKQLTWKSEPGPIVHACNPTYLGRERLGGSWFEVSSAKKLVRFHLNQKLEVVACPPFPF